MGICQVRIFVRSSEPLQYWAETMAGRLIMPLIDEFSDSLEWFWFSRYIEYGVRLDIYGFEGVNCQEWHGEHAFTILELSIM